MLNTSKSAEPDPSLAQKTKVTWSVIGHG